MINPDDTLGDILKIAIITAVVIIAIGSCWLFINVGDIKGLLLEDTMIKIPLRFDIETNITVEVDTIAQPTTIPINIEVEAGGRTDTVQMPIIMSVASIVNQTVTGNTSVPIQIDIVTNVTNSTG